MRSSVTRNFIVFQLRFLFLRLLSIFVDELTQLIYAKVNTIIASITYVWSKRLFIFNHIYILLYNLLQLYLCTTIVITKKYWIRCLLEFLFLYYSQSISTCLSIRPFSYSSMKYILVTFLYISRLVVWLVWKIVIVPLLACSA